MNSQYHIDTPKRADYPLPAGLHCQPVVAGRVHIQRIRFAPSEGGDLCVKKPPSPLTLR